ncbi:MAG TPA: hypothetical protein DHV50_01165, partial [Erythrobacter sp.]|nr:hypothetical protein [Erythrobacter sp.]
MAVGKSPRRRRSPRRSRGFSAAGKAWLVALLVAAIAAGYAWYEARSWRPDESAWPDQGALVSAGDGAVDFDTLAG